MKRTALIAAAFALTVSTASAFVNTNSVFAEDIAELSFTTPDKTVLTNDDLNKPTADYQGAPGNQDIQAAGADLDMSELHDSQIGYWKVKKDADWDTASGGAYPTYQEGTYRYRFSMEGLKLKNGKTFPANAPKITLNGVEFSTESVDGINDAYYFVDVANGTLSFSAYSPEYKLPMADAPQEDPAAPAVQPGADGAADNSANPAAPVKAESDMKEAMPTEAKATALADTGSALYAVVAGGVLLAVTGVGVVRFVRR